MAKKSTAQFNRMMGTLLVFYLLGIGLTAIINITLNFPTIISDKLIFPTGAGGKADIWPFGNNLSSDQGLIILAFLAGIAGSFLHAAQSLSSYLGNTEFKGSWTSWYFLRPWVGGILGLVIYFAFRAGLIAGASVVNPYGVVAIGLLGGWFSKTTTDKMQEVFETLFKTDGDRQRKDKLTEYDRPVIDRFEPESITEESVVLIYGLHFMEGSQVILDGEEVETEFIDETQLKISIGQPEARPQSDREILVQIKNPEGIEPISKGKKILFKSK